MNNNKMILNNKIIKINIRIDKKFTVLIYLKYLF